MLKFDDVRTIEGYQVNRDDMSETTFYVLPDNPRISRMDGGGLALRFVEYNQLRESGDKKFGGFIAMDVELSIPEEKSALIAQKLQEEIDQKFQGRPTPPPKVTIAPIPWIGGSVQLLLQQDSAIVEKITNSDRPSLYGRNIASFQIEVTELGREIFKETLQKGVASGIQVVYHLQYYTRLPKMTALATWNASEFYSFFQDINTEDHFWSEDSRTEVVNSSRYKNDVTHIEYHFIGDPNIKPEDQQKADSEIRTMINNQLNEAVKRNMLTAIADVDPSTKDLEQDQGIEDIRRTVNKSQIANVTISWEEDKAIITEKSPQGMLPTVTSMKDGHGQAAKWEDYHTKIDLDEFLKTMAVTMRVNAPFDTLPIHSVEVKVSYPWGPLAKTQEFTFTSPDDVAKFEAFVFEGNRKIKFSYSVNYKNSTFRYQSPEVETDETNLVISVGDLGMLVVDIEQGGIDFDKVPRAEVVVTYAGGAQPVERRFNMTKDARTFQIREIIETKIEKPFSYQVTYTMADGREIVGPVRQQSARTLSIDDPFTANRTVSFRVGSGNLDIDVTSITVEADYQEAANDYRQHKVVQLSKAAPFLDWTFPVIDEKGGVLTYSGSISFANGTSRDIPATTATHDVIKIEAVSGGYLEITVAPDLIDWTKVKLVNVSLSYDGGAAPARTDIRLKQGDAEKTWKVPMSDAASISYTETITYYLLDGTRQSSGPTTQTALSILPELSA